MVMLHGQDRRAWYRSPEPACSDHGRDGEVRTPRGSQECLVEGDEQEGPAFARLERGGEVDRVVRSQAVMLSEVPGRLGDPLLDLHPDELAPASLQLRPGCPKPGPRQPSSPSRRRERRSTLGVREPARHETGGLVPQDLGVRRLRLGNQELHQGGGLEVRDQRRCSATNSETLPLAFTGGRARAGSLGIVGGSARPCEISR